MPVCFQKAFTGGAQLVPERSLAGSHLEVLYWQDVLSPTVMTEPPLPGQSSLLHISPRAPTLLRNHSFQHYGQADLQSSLPTQTIP